MLGLQGITLSCVIFPRWYLTVRVRSFPAQSEVSEALIRSFPRQYLQFFRHSEIRIKIYLTRVIALSWKYYILLSLNLIIYIHGHTHAIYPQYNKIFYKIQFTCVNKKVVYKIIFTFVFFFFCFCCKLHKLQHLNYLVQQYCPNFIYTVKW